MITVTFYKNAKGIYSGFRTIGHAGYAESGQDIICSAVSALVINTINSIGTLTSDDYTLNANEESGLIDFKIKDSVSHESVLLLKSLILGLEGIREDYGKKYIKLKI